LIKFNGGLLVGWMLNSLAVDDEWFFILSLLTFDHFRWMDVILDGGIPVVGLQKLAEGSVA
jgi:hypothetical protein